MDQPALTQSGFIIERIRHRVSRDLDKDEGSDLLTDQENKMSDSAKDFDIRRYSSIVESILSSSHSDFN
jgi:hypothetical protein